MRIIGKEIKKILDIRLLVILAVFTLLYYMVFMEVVRHPVGGQCTASPYDIIFYAELIEEWGPELSIDDWDKVEKKRQEITMELESLFVDNTILKENGIATLEAFYEKRDELEGKDYKDMTEEEKQLDDEIADCFFKNEAYSKLLFNLQALEEIDSRKGYQFNVNQKRMKEFEEDGLFSDLTSQNAIEKEKQIMESDRMSLLHEGIAYIWNQDVKSLCILMLIGCFVLIIPYQIREKISGGMQIFTCTHTGRKIFGKQFVACLLSCGLVGCIQMLAYLLFWHIKGLSVFWSCKYNCIGLTSWDSEWTLGLHMLVEMLLMLIFALATVSLIYILARLVPNYVAGIACSIPVCIGVGKLQCFIFYYLFNIRGKFVQSYWAIYAIGIWVLLMGIFMGLRLRRDWRMDL